VPGALLAGQFILAHYDIRAAVGRKLNGTSSLSADGVTSLWTDVRMSSSDLRHWGKTTPEERPLTHMF
jgi:hypothetical protein